MALALLDDVLGATGGADWWRGLQGFTVHLSIRGELLARKHGAVNLKDLVVEGRTREQSLEIIGFTSPNLRALYQPGRVALETSEGQLLRERRVESSAFADQVKLNTWDDLLLAYICGNFIWNYLAVPFILTEPDVMTEMLEPIAATDTWRRLKVRLPPRIVTHSPVQILHFDQEGRLRRLDYVSGKGPCKGIAQMLSGHQRFSGWLVPTLCRVLKVGANGHGTGRSALIDVEIFDAIVE
jgi:hypothetical protein